MNFKHGWRALLGASCVVLSSTAFADSVPLSLSRATPETLFAETLRAATARVLTAAANDATRIPSTTRVVPERPLPMRVDLIEGKLSLPTSSTGQKGHEPRPSATPTTTATASHRSSLMPSDTSHIRHQSTERFYANVKSQTPDRIVSVCFGSYPQMTAVLRPFPELMTGDLAAHLFETTAADKWQNCSARARESLAHPRTTPMQADKSHLIVVSSEDIARRGQTITRTDADISYEPYSKQQTIKALQEASRLAAVPYQTSNASASQASASKMYPRRITVQIGMFATLLTKGVKSVAIADPTVADVVVLSTRSVLVNGKSQGTTNLVLLDAGGIRTYEVQVVDRLGTSSEEIERAIGLPKVRVRLIGDAVILDGEADSNDEAAQAKAIAGLYGQKIVDLLTVREPVVKDERPDISKQVREAIDVPGVQVRAVGDSILLQGTVKSDTAKQQAERIASLYTAQVVNLIEVELAPPPVPPSLAEILEMISVSTIRAKEVRDRIILEGEAPNAAAKDRAATIAAQSGKTIDNLIVTPEEKLASAAAKAKQIEAAIGIDGVRVQASEELLILTGTVPTAQDAERALQLAKSFAENVESQLEVPKLHQVRVELMIVEMQVNRLRELGFAPGLGTSYLTLDASTTFGEGIPGFDSTNLGNLAVTLRALQTNNQAKILSAPSATVVSGKELDFKVGGEVPLPSTSYGTSGTAGGALTESVEFKEFGILMNVKPTVLNTDNVNLVIRTEVSQPNYANAVLIGTSLVPGFDTRNSQTEVIIKHAETLVIAGLIKNESIKNKQALPVLSKIPILGELFQSTSYQRNETELVIFVTPRVTEIK